MCVVKTPKVTPAEQKVKDPIVIRNPYLDGTGPQQKALRMGRSSLRIERGGARATPVAPPPSVLPPAGSPTPIVSWPSTPVRGGGGGGLEGRFVSYV